MDIYPLINGGGTGFIVKDWSFPHKRNQEPWTTSRGFEWINIPNVSGVQSWWDSASYLWIECAVDVADSTGDEGQSSENPLSTFTDHGLVMVGTRLYDPSYGMRYDGGLDEFESDAIEGYISPSRPITNSRSMKIGSIAT